MSDTTGFVPPFTAPRQGCKQLVLPKNRYPKEIPSNVDRANNPAGIPSGCSNWGKFTGGVAAAPPTGYRLGCLRLKQPAPPTNRSHYNPLHGPTDEMVFRAGVGRTDTAKRSPEQGVDVACSDHTKELVWRHLTVVERERELRCRLPRGRGQTPDPSHPLKTAKNPRLKNRIRNMRGLHRKHPAKLPFFDASPRSRVGRTLWNCIIGSPMTGLISRC